MMVTEVHISGHSTNYSIAGKSTCNDLYYATCVNNKLLTYPDTKN